MQEPGVRPCLHHWDRLSWPCYLLIMHDLLCLLSIVEDGGCTVYLCRHPGPNYSTILLGAQPALRRRQYIQDSYPRLLIPPTFHSIYINLLTLIVIGGGKKHSLEFSIFCPCLHNNNTANREAATKASFFSGPATFGDFFRASKKCIFS